MEKGHPHVHYMFWRNDGKVMSSFIHTSRQNKVRQNAKELRKKETELLRLLQKTNNQQKQALKDAAKKNEVGAQHTEE